MDGNIPYVAFDLDGTLVTYDEYRGPDHIGKPILPTIGRVKQLLAKGTHVKIMTARVASDNPIAARSREIVANWCELYIGRVLPVTAEKGYTMVEQWDDRAVQVIPNSGIPMKDLLQRALQILADDPREEAISFIKLCSELGL